MYSPSSSAWVLPLLAAGCNEPTYTDARGNVEVSPLDQNGMPTGVSKPTEEAVLPIYQLDTDMPDDFRVRREANRVLAMMRATATGTVPEMVPLLLRGDFAIQVDWTLKNLEDMPATATVVLHGSNEFVRYEPTMVMLGEDEDAPPALLGGTPFEVAAGATVNGTFREDQLDEATLDLDYIRRTPDPMPDPNMPGMHFMPERAPIVASQAPGETRDVVMHDGGVMRIKRLDDEYDPADTVRAMAYLESHRAKGIVVTGLLYVAENAS